MKDAPWERVGVNSGRTMDVEVVDEGGTPHSALRCATGPRARATGHARKGGCLRWHLEDRTAAARRVAGSRAAAANRGRSTMTSVLLVDDQPLLRMALRVVLKAHENLSMR